MYDLIKKKLSGLKDQIREFMEELEKIAPSENKKMVDHVIRGMKDIGYEQIRADDTGNVIGRIKGYSEGPGLLLLSHVLVPGISDEGNYTVNEVSPEPRGDNGWKGGIVSALFAGALMKRSLLPFKGNLYVACVPRTTCSAFGVKRLFEEDASGALASVKGVIMSEPTACNVYIGHKGRIEYEISIKGIMNERFLESKGVNMLGSMFPLVNELERVATNLPRNERLGASHLKIKSVSYSDIGYDSPKREFKVRVDRDFVPEENAEEILERAKGIGTKLYCGQKNVRVKTALVKERVRTLGGKKMISIKKSDSWMIESHHPFVLEALKGLRMSGINSEVGYWKEHITEGSYLFRERNIPTIGFGPGSELESGPMEVKEIARSVLGQVSIINRNLGFPTFGWSQDEA